MRRILDEWQIQVRVEMMRNGWTNEDLIKELKKRGVDIKPVVVKAAIAREGYAGAGIKICDALGITERLSEDDRPKYIYEGAGLNG